MIYVDRYVKRKLRATEGKRLLHAYWIPGSKRIMGNKRADEIAESAI